MSIHDTFSRHRIPKWKIPLIVIHTRLKMKRILHTIPLCDGIKDVIHDLRRAGIPIYIASSNSTSNIRTYLTLHNISGFDGITGGIGLHAKASALRSLCASIRNRSHSHQPVLYVGDEVRDIEAVRTVEGLHIASVTWGLNTRDLLATYHPDHLCTTPHELSALMGA